MEKIVKEIEPKLPRGTTVLVRGQLTTMQNSFFRLGMGMIFAVVLAKGSVLKAIAMIVFGLLLSMVGSDIETGASRMAFNIPELADGLGFATVAMGVFGFAEIIRNLDAGSEMNRDLVQQKITGLMPTRKDLIDSAPAIARGTLATHDSMDASSSASPLPASTAGRSARRVHPRTSTCATLPRQRQRRWPATGRAFAVVLKRRPARPPGSAPRPSSLGHCVSSATASSMSRASSPLPIVWA